MCASNGVAVVPSLGVGVTSASAPRVSGAACLRAPHAEAALGLAEANGQNMVLTGLVIPPLPPIRRPHGTAMLRPDRWSGSGQR